MNERVRITGGFTAIPNAVLRSCDLSLECKGMLSLIASHAGNWQFRRDDMLKKSGCSKNKYYRIINDLKASGYLEVVPLDTSNGRFSGSEWILHFEPRPQNSDTEPCPQIGDLPRPQKPDTEKGDTKKNNPKKNKRIPPNPPRGADDRNPRFGMRQEFIDKMKGQTA